jgi:hypothetical protein
MPSTTTEISYPIGALTDLEQLFWMTDWINDLLRAAHENVVAAEELASKARIDWKDESQAASLIRDLGLPDQQALAVQEKVERFQKELAGLDARFQLRTAAEAADALHVALDEAMDETPLRGDPSKRVAVVEER